jgi:hypothetical protein
MEWLAQNPTEVFNIRTMEKRFTVSLAALAVAATKAGAAFQFQ